MSSPTPEQAAVLDSKARIRMVCAAPGSGKTWLVAEAIRRELLDWGNRSCGIAALSFTNVAGEEIRSAVGCELGHPHFVGTLDAFLFRYVVRPFGQRLSKHLPCLRLIPADLAESLSKGPGGYDLDVAIGDKSGHQRCNLFEAFFIGERDGNPILAHSPPYHARIEELPPEDTTTVLQAKKRLWKRLGWLSHSDAAYLASLVLEHKVLGPLACHVITSRFPMIIVDEIQDTGWFLGKSIMSLVNEPMVRGLLVGDPDQAIFEFNGATPASCERFRSLPDAQLFDIRQTWRCSPSVCTAADHLSQSNAKIVPSASRKGSPFLLTYDKPADEINELRKLLGITMPAARHRVVARTNAAVEQIRGKKVQEAPKIGSPPLNFLHRAVNCFRQGRRQAALAAAMSALAYPLFDHTAPSEGDLDEKGLDLAGWKQAAVGLLLAANAVVEKESLYDWGMRMRREISLVIGGLLPKSAATVRAPRTDLKGDSRSQYLVRQAGDESLANVPVQTVHAVKGETHDTTLLYCPRPRRPEQCPSHVWWSSDPTFQEERRIAFVAATRSCGDFLLCVSKETAERLEKNRPEFASSFVRMSLGEFVDGMKRRSRESRS